MTQDRDLSQRFGAQCEEARAALRRHMMERGLLEENGWRIYESTRQVAGRTELVMRPVHLRLTAPPELECVVIIDEPGSNISFECRD